MRNSAFRTNMHSLLINKNAFLFDFNGTLSNDETILENVFDQSLAKLDLEGLRTGEYATVLGMSDVDITRELAAARHAEDRQTELLAAVASTYGRVFAQATRAGNSPITDAAVGLVSSLEAIGASVGIVTGTLRAMLVPALQARGLSHLSALSVTADDVQHGKPDPEGYVMGCQLLGVQPGDTLAFEDSPAGITAACAAGLEVIGIGPVVADDTRALAHFPTLDALAQELSEDSA